MNLLLPSPPLAVEANFPFHFVFTPRFFTSLKGFVMQWIRTLLSFIFMHATSEEEQRKLFSRPNDQKALCMSVYCGLLRNRLHFLFTLHACRACIGKRPSNIRSLAQARIHLRVSLSLDPKRGGKFQERSYFNNHFQILLLMC